MGRGLSYNPAAEGHAFARPGLGLARVGSGARRQPGGRLNRVRRRGHPKTRNRQGQALCTLPTEGADILLHTCMAQLCANARILLSNDTDNSSIGLGASCLPLPFSKLAQELKALTACSGSGGDAQLQWDCARGGGRGSGGGGERARRRDAHTDAAGCRAPHPHRARPGGLVKGIEARRASCCQPSAPRFKGGPLAAVFGT